MEQIETQEILFINCKLKLFLEHQEEWEQTLTILCHVYDPSANEILSFGYL